MFNNKLQSPKAPKAVEYREMEKAQRLLGLHAAFVWLLCTGLQESKQRWWAGPRQQESDKDYTAHTFCGLCFVAFLAATPWMQRSAAKKQGEERHLFFVWATAFACFLCVFFFVLPPIVLLYDLFRHIALLSALFLALQPALASLAAKCVLGMLLLGLHAAHYHTNNHNEVGVLLSAYTMAALWSAWVLYDTRYWHQQGVLDPYRLSMLTICDLTVAAFAACLLPSYAPET